MLAVILISYFTGYELIAPEAGMSIAAAPYIDLAGTCQKILRQMKSLTGSNYAMDIGGSTGTLDFLLGHANPGAPKSELISVDSGKKLIVTKVVYKQPTNNCEVLTGSNAAAATLCDTPREDDEKSVEVTITQKVALQPRAFSNERMINICQDTEAFVKEYLISDMRAIREKINIQSLALLLANSGKNYHQDGSTPTAAGSDKDVKLLANDSFGQPVPLTGNFNKIIMDYNNNYLRGLPNFIGQGNLETYLSLRNLACCNTSIPYGQAVAGGAAFYQDHFANPVLGTNKFLVIAPGISHALFFNENANINIKSDIVQHLVVPDPQYPMIKYDFDFKWDECAKKWIYFISVWHDVFNAFQANAFKAESPEVSPICDHERLGMTGTLYYEATSA